MNIVALIKKKEFERNYVKVASHSLYSVHNDSVNQVIASVSELH